MFDKNSPDSNSAAFDNTIDKPTAAAVVNAVNNKGGLILVLCEDGCFLLWIC
jgi:hypothetical protein